MPEYPHGRWAHLERRRPILDLTSRAELAAGDIGVRSALARGLGSVSSGWTARARVGRAFCAGIGAALVIEGAETHQPRSPDLSSRNRFFICLRAPGHPNGFWASEASSFFRAVAGERGERFHPETVCHGFLRELRSVLSSQALTRNGQQSCAASAEGGGHQNPGGVPHGGYHPAFFASHQ